MDENTDANRKRGRETYSPLSKKANTTETLFDLLSKFETDDNDALYENILIKIQNKEFDYDGVNSGSNMLMYLINMYLTHDNIKHKQLYENLILALIRTGKVNQNVTYYREKRFTILMTVCMSKLNNIALALVATGESAPDRTDYQDMTALMHACENHLPDVAMAIIQTGDAAIYEIDIDDNNALMYACLNNLNDVASFLIDEYMAFDPEFISKYDIAENTAFLYACENGMANVAMKLLETGHANPYKLNISKETACDFLIKYKREHPGDNSELDAIINRLTISNDELSPVEISEGSEGHSFVLNDDINVKNYLDEDNDNLCFIMNNNYYFLSTKTELRTHLKDNANIKYKCYEAGDNVYDDKGRLLGRNFAAQDNYDTSVKYFSISLIIGAKVLVQYDYMVKIIQSNVKAFRLISTDERVPSVISEYSSIEGPGTYGADYCQTHKDAQIYNIEPLRITWTPAPTPLLRETIEPTPLAQEINVQYKGKIYKFPITVNTTIGNVKEMLINELSSENIKPGNIRFIYLGKIYTNPEIMLNTLKDPPYGITLQSLLSPSPSGGRKTRKKRRLNRRKTKRTN